MNLFDLLDRPIAFHRPLVTITKSVSSALMLSQAIYWTNRTEDPNGWFWKSRDGWLDELGLSHEEQETARKRLIKIGVWEERYERLHHRTWFRVKREELGALIRSAEIPNRESRFGETVKPALPTPSLPVSTKDKVTTSEITSALFPLPEKTKKPKLGTVNGHKPTEEVISAFCQTIDLPRSDGEIMRMKWDADGWPKNWMDKIRYWKRMGYMPSQKSDPARRQPLENQI